MIKAILLDLGNVIVPVDFARCHAAFSEVSSLPPAEIPARLRPTGLSERFETGRMSPQEFADEVCVALGMRATYPQFWEIWSTIFLPETLISESLLEGLRRRQRLVLLSNTNAVHFQFARERYALLGHFDDYVLSYEVGAVKPSPAIYREAVARAGCRPAECFFTDDVPKFVEAACREGIDAVEFQSQKHLESEMAARGITW
jgi:putative hydrolase of the HAD superfamily